MSHPRHAIGYRRVSTSEQANSGLGLDAQTTAITTAAARLGLPLAAMFTDAGLSGSLALDQRPSLLGALAALRRGDTLIVAKRDRLGRDVLNVALIQRLVERKPARLVSAAGEGSDDDGPTSVLMRQIVDAFSQYERAIICARTRAALQVKKSRAERVGGIPFGYTLAADGVHFDPQADEQHVLATLRDLRATGYTWRAIATELNRQGFRTRAGTPWQHQYCLRLAS